MAFWSLTKNQRQEKKKGGGKNVQWIKPVEVNWRQETTCKVMVESLALLIIDEEKWVGRLLLLV